MVPIFPKQIAVKGIVLYLIALAVVSVAFFKYALGIPFILLGVMWVVGFFGLSCYCSKKWVRISNKDFFWTLFAVALIIRVVWVFFSYYFYEAKTGIPFEFSAADSLMYHESASAFAESYKWSPGNLAKFYSDIPFSDLGYFYWLSTLYSIFGPSIIGTRLLKSIIGAFTVCAIYKLAERNLGDFPGRMAGIFACFMPNLIVYCGLHLKETEMLFLLVAFLERADYLIHTKKYSFVTIIVPSLLALSLLFFRTVLGAAAILSFATGVLFTSTKVIGKGKRVLLIAWGVLALSYFIGGTVVNEVQSVWEERDENVVQKRSNQVNQGVAWAKYATGAVMAPIVFILPFPTMVDVDEQYNQQVISGGNFVKNFLGVFVLIALFDALFKRKNWRDLSLIGSFVIGYLGVISMSGYSNSERFLLPALPVLLIMAAYGIYLLNAKYYRIAKIWYWVVPVMAVAWAFFKLGARALF